MRISDWSSDVCSSDLMLCVLRRCPAASARPTLRRNKDARSRPEGKHETNQAAGRRLAVCRHARDANAGGLPGDFFAAAEGWTSISQEVGREIPGDARLRSEAHTSELQSLMRISSAVFCLNKTNSTN